MTRLSINPFCCHHLQLRLAILVLRGHGLQLKFNSLAVISHQASGRLSFFHSTTVTTLAVLCCILYNCVWLHYLSLWYPYELYAMQLTDGWHNDWNKWLVACAHATTHICCAHHLHTYFTAHLIPQGPYLVFIILFTCTQDLEQEYCIWHQDYKSTPPHFHFKSLTARLMLADGLHLMSTSWT